MMTHRNHDIEERNFRIGMVLFIIFILALLFCAVAFTTKPCAAELNIGMGTTYKYENKNAFLIAYEKSDWRYEYTYIDTYQRKTESIKHHSTLAISNKLWFNSGWFFDLGLAYSSRQASTTSSPFVFIERFGYRANRFKIYLRHTSNAGIVGPNAGEDLLIFEYLL